MSIKWVSGREYCRLTGISRANVNKLIEEGRLTHTETEGGQIRIMIEGNEDVLTLKEELDEAKEMLRLLCKHLGVNR